MSTYPPDPSERESFQDPRPVLRVTCYRCHGFRVIDWYACGKHHPQNCTARDQNGMIEVYAPLS